MHTFCLCQYCRSALTCWQWRNFKSSDVCEGESCVQTSWPFLWSGHTLSRSLAARWHAFFWVASRTSQTSASLTPVLHFSLFDFSSHLSLSPSLSLCLSVSLSPCSHIHLVQHLSRILPASVTKAKIKQTCHLSWFGGQSAEECELSVPTEHSVVGLLSLWQAYYGAVF